MASKIFGRSWSYISHENCKRVHSVLGKPIDDLAIKLIAARPVQRNSPIVKRRVVNMIDLEF